MSTPVTIHPSLVRGRPLGPAVLVGLVRGGLGGALVPGSLAALVVYRSNGGPLDVLTSVLACAAFVATLEVGLSVAERLESPFWQAVARFLGGAGAPLATLVPLLPLPSVASTPRPDASLIVAFLWFALSVGFGFAFASPKTHDRLEATFTAFVSAALLASVPLAIFGPAFLGGAVIVALTLTFLVVPGVMATGPLARRLSLTLEPELETDPAERHALAVALSEREPDPARALDHARDALELARAWPALAESRRPDAARVVALLSRLGGARLDELDAVLEGFPEKDALRAEATRARPDERGPA